MKSEFHEMKISSDGKSYPLRCVKLLLITRILSMPLWVTKYTLG